MYNDKRNTDKTYNDKTYTRQNVYRDKTYTATKCIRDKTSNDKTSTRQKVYHDKTYTRQNAYRDKTHTATKHIRNKTSTKEIKTSLKLQTVAKTTIKSRLCSIKGFGSVLSQQSSDSPPCFSQNRPQQIDLFGISRSPAFGWLCWPAYG